MSLKSFTIAIGLLITFACSSDDNPSSVNGTYIGTFQRGDAISNVELTLENLNFSGQSEVAKYPAICNGTFTFSANSIDFENLCAWTADFDWSLILSERWNYSMSGNTLTLTNSIGDTYILNRQD